jgi:serine/threonine protein kinase
MDIIPGMHIGMSLGFGATSTVLRGTGNDGSQVALKIVDADHVNAANAEESTLDRLAHPHIVKLDQVHRNVRFPDGSLKTILQLELCEHGELFKLIEDSGAMDEMLARTYFRQLLKAIQACHSNEIWHRDVKLENMLLDHDFNLKLSDFGYATSVDDPLVFRFAILGTPLYMAPEIVSGRVGAYDGTKTDIWSMGVCLFTMLTSSHPFNLAGGDDWWFRAVQAGRHDRFWAAHLRTSPAISEDAQDLLNRIFAVDPAQRPSADDLLRHPWMAGPTLEPNELREVMAMRCGIVTEVPTPAVIAIVEAAVDAAAVDAAAEFVVVVSEATAHHPVELCHGRFEAGIASKKPRSIASAFGGGGGAGGGGGGGDGGGGRASYHPETALSAAAGSRSNSPKRKAEFLGQ